MKKHDHRHLILAVTDDRQLLSHLRSALPDEELQVADSVPGIRKQLAEAPAAVLIQDTLLNGELNGVLEELHEQAVPPMVTLLADTERLNAAIQYLHEGLVFRFQTTPCNMQQLDLALHACIEQYDMLQHQRSMQQEIDRQVKLRTGNLQKLYNYVSIINDRESIQDICDLAVELTAEILNSKRVSLLLPDQHNRLLEMVSAVYRKNNRSTLTYQGSETDAAPP